MPETHQPVKPADAALVSRLNQSVGGGTLRNRAGRPVSEAFEAGLLREDGAVLYPIRHDIPVMLVDEGIPVS